MSFDPTLVKVLQKNHFENRARDEKDRERERLAEEMDLLGINVYIYIFYVCMYVCMYVCIYIRIGRERD
jgi:hypothetical protein